MKADRKETLRYLGYRGQEIDSQTERLLDEVEAELERDSSPKSIYQEYPCEADGDKVTIGGVYHPKREPCQKFKRLRACSPPCSHHRARGRFYGKKIFCHKYGKGGHYPSRRGSLY